VEDATELTLEVIGSKWSYAQKWCKPNDDDDDRHDGNVNQKRYDGDVPSIPIAATQFTITIFSTCQCSTHLTTMVINIRVFRVLHHSRVEVG